MTSSFEFPIGHDLAYWPDVDRWLHLHTNGRAVRVLLHGGQDQARVKDGDRVEVRHAPRLPLSLPAGTYLFADGADFDVLVVCTGQPAPVKTASYRRIEDDHFLAAARQTFNALWSTATPTGPASTFQLGDSVQIVGSGAVGVVSKHEWDGSEHRYFVNFGGSGGFFGEAGLRSFRSDSLEPSEWIESEPSSAEEVALRLTLTKLSHPLTDTIYSYLSSKTVFRPYQFRPVLRLINSSHQRLLIADEVGLGKTIEAGLIWSELEQRTPLHRALIVCPAMLVHKWRDEMRRRFDRTVRLVDRAGLEELVNLFRGGDFETPWYGVASLEGLRTSPLLEELQQVQPRFDLVIVDEAHYLRNPLTKSYDLGELLSDWADALLFLSATPLNLGSDDLFNLLALLHPSEYADRSIFVAQLAPNEVINEVASTLVNKRDQPRTLLATLNGLGTLEFGRAVTAKPEFDELVALLDRESALTFDETARARGLLAQLHVLSGVVNRTRKTDVPEAKAVREAVSIEVDISEVERRFYDAVREWTIRRARERGIPPGFAMQMPLRQTASCIPAMLDRLASHEDFSFDDDDFDELSDLFSEHDDEQLAVEGIGARAREMLDKFAKDNHDSKYLAFVGRLRQARQAGLGPTMVFSFFRRTIEYLDERLRLDGFRTAFMHGGIDPDRRIEIMRDFRAGRFDILLLSEVGSEGLDFEFCQVVVNYDLPWNPMRVEQRIGRIDRFGQEHEKIFIWNFHVPGTIETDIFERLYIRIGAFERSIGALEPILRSPVAELQRVMFDPKLSDEQREQRIEELQVAIAERSQDIDRLDESVGQLGVMDQVLVEGLEQELERGRFVGPTEIVRLFRSFAAGTRARLSLPDEAIGEVVGDEDFADRFIRTRVVSTGSRYSLVDLGARLRDGEPIPVTTSNEVASKTQLDLLSIRHPFVRAAVEHHRQLGGASAGRYGRVSVPGLPAGEYCVLLFLLEATGAQPRLELRTAAVDLSDATIASDAGDVLLSAVAHGHLREATAVGPRSVLYDAVHVATQRMHQIRNELQGAQEARNEALVQARIAAVRSSCMNKIARSTDQLQHQRDARIRRLHLGRIRNLEIERDHRIAALEALREVAVSVTPVALVHMQTGRDGA